jgi:hypothetical protein
MDRRIHLSHVVQVEIGLGEISRIADDDVDLAAHSAAVQADGLRTIRIDAYDQLGTRIRRGGAHPNASENDEHADGERGNDLLATRDRPGSASRHIRPFEIENTARQGGATVSTNPAFGAQ